MEVSHSNYMKTDAVINRLETVRDAKLRASRILCDPFQVCLFNIIGSVGALVCSSCSLYLSFEENPERRRTFYVIGLPILCGFFVVYLGAVGWLITTRCQRKKRLQNEHAKIDQLIQEIPKTEQRFPSEKVSAVSSYLTVDEWRRADQFQLREVYLKEGANQFLPRMNNRFIGYDLRDLFQKLEELTQSDPQEIANFVSSDFKHGSSLLEWLIQDLPEEKFVDPLVQSALKAAVGKLLQREIDDQTLNFLREGKSFADLIQKTKKI